MIGMAATLDGNPIGRRQLLRTLGLTASVTAVGGACSLDFGDPERPNSLWIRQAARAPGPAHDRAYRQVGWIVDDRRGKERGDVPRCSGPLRIQPSGADHAGRNEGVRVLPEHVGDAPRIRRSRGLGDEGRSPELPALRREPLMLRSGQLDGRPPHANRIGFAIHDFDRESVAARLRDRREEGGGWTRSRSRSSGGRSPILMVLRVDIAGGWSAGASRARMRGRSGAVPRGAGGVACGSVSA